MMRYMHILSDAPDEFWPFSMLESVAILNVTRERDVDGTLTSVRELWCGKKPSVARIYVMFCLVIMRKPVAWRGGKLDDRALECVYCGRAVRSQGVYGCGIPTTAS